MPAVTERPPANLPEPYRIAAVAIGAVLGMVLVLYHAADMSPGAIALVLAPMLVGGTTMLGYYLWTSRRGAR